ncbi:MAG: peptide ABC transporter substrate-binding protein, partial [Chloroflexaceae bacterium]|nr:peptide ABC transporter substrate-binding protein [Chloroflexaceae bacterium]
MARRIRWQMIIAACSSVLVVLLLGNLALSTMVSRPRAGGTYVEALPGAPAQVIPLLNDPLNDPVGRDLGALLFEGLTRIGPDGSPVPALAEQIDVDQGGEVYLFRLRRDVVWHDGEPFDADDAIFTLNTIQDARFTGDPALANLWRGVLVDRIDAFTIRCTLTSPYAPFLDAARVPVLPAHLLAGVAIEQWPESFFARQPVGTGPYRLVELTTDHALLEANPDYFGGAPFIEQLDLRFIDTPQAAFSLLTRHEAHALGLRASPDFNQVMLPQTFRRIPVPLDEYAVLTFNMRQPPLDLLELRQALAYGLEKDTLIERVAQGIAIRLDTPILPGWFAPEPGEDPPTSLWYPYDPVTAGGILDRLGYEATPGGSRARNGEPLVLPLLTDHDPLRLAAAQEVARQWANLGIVVEVQPLDREAFYQRLQSHDFVLAIHAWARLGADPDGFELWHSSQAESGLNYAGLRDEFLDRMLTEGRMELDSATRRQISASFQDRWVELVPSIILYQPLYTFAASNELGGMGFEAPESASNLLLVGGRRPLPPGVRLVYRAFPRDSGKCAIGCSSGK